MNLPRPGLGPIISATCAVIILVGVFSPFEYTYLAETTGIELNEGIIALAMGIVALALCAGRVLFKLDNAIYIPAGITAAAIAFVPTLLWYIDYEQRPQGEIFGTTFDISDIGSGAMLIMGGALALTISLVVQAFTTSWKTPLLALPAPQPPQTPAATSTDG